MGHERLLERLRSVEQDPLRREAGDHHLLVNTILSHLGLLLNTRQGSVPIAEDYGMPDFLDLLQRYPASVREIESDVRRAIEPYEPRLEGVQVALLPQEDDLLSLRFHIQARLRGDGAIISFETRVESDGRISLRH